MISAYRESSLQANHPSTATNKKESTYQKLSVFRHFESKEPSLQIDEEMELCKVYIAIQRQNRQSMQ